LSLPVQVHAVLTLSSCRTSPSYRLSFFSYCHGEPGDLHSFPTRRSSDLDSLIKRLDDDRYALKVTPRQPTSKWSDINRNRWLELDRKSTRLNSSHGSISYAVFCLKKKKR